MERSVSESYAKSLAIWVARFKDSQEEIRNLEKEKSDLWRTVVILLRKLGGDVVITDKEILEYDEARSAITVVGRNLPEGGTRVTVD